MTNHNLQNISILLIDVAKEAGKMIAAAQPTLSTTSMKKNTADIVTETDQAVEKFIHQTLQERFPTFAFIGEETYKNGDTLTHEPTFIVDPIDGTSNFVHGFPAVCVSIALVIDRQPTIGVVYSPFQDELWTAVRGGGAFVTQGSGSPKRLPLRSPPLESLQIASIGLEWGSDREGPNFDMNLKVFTTLARTVATGGRFANSLRFMGSAAIAMCRVAAGQQDAFWECGCWAWDVAAAWCILLEAGGIMVDGHPGNMNPPLDNRRYLAVRPSMGGQREFVEDFWSVIGDSRSTYGPA
ncbi:quinic acid utilization QUTG (inositol-1(or 4)-monophosphatase) [Fusarium mexicanum]|uniref:Inositol-1-monophosphatase n=1 Tax=Fusarium mexicanum TaxID=751941 RepID=A0A8H5IE82_9HYPO|nr:quinic acid utilization QUTG (inositol-1(or 4)-monophosphatase) [Fusarium mexicanum]